MTRELTERENQILRLIAKGLSYKMVAADLNVSHKTIKNHVSKILLKLEAGNSPHAVAIAKDRGIL